MAPPRPSRRRSSRPASRPRPRPLDVDPADPAGSLAAAFAAAWPAAKARGNRYPGSGPLVSALRAPLRLAERLVDAAQGPGAGTAAGLAAVLDDAVCRVQRALYKVDDSSGALNDTGRTLMQLLGQAWAAMPADDRAALPKRVIAMLALADDFMLQNLIADAAPGLGPDGLQRVREHIERRLTELGPETDRPASDDNWAERVVLTSQLKLTLLALGEVDAYIALEESRPRGIGYRTLEIAENLMRAGRVADALARIETSLAARAEPGSREACSPQDVPALLQRRTECHELLGDAEGAVASDWAAYRETLGDEPLSALLNRAAPEDRAPIFAEAASIAFEHPDAARAVRRLAAIGAVDDAADRLRPVVDEISRYEWWELQDVPGQIESRYPELTWRMYKAQLRSLLEPTRKSAYRAAAFHLLACRRLAAAHAAELAGAQDELEAFMRAKHGQKRTFWELVAEKEGRGGAG